MSEYQFRLAKLEDAETICDHRYAMFADMGMEADMLALARPHYLPWLQERLENGIYSGIMVEYEGEIIAGAGMWVVHLAPMPMLHSSDTRRGSIVNVYTHPDHRRKGLARQMVDRLIEIAREQGLLMLVLHASDTGRPLYESMGFHETHEMRLFL